MSAQEQVQKLQALLTRVNDRRNAPRSTLVSATSAEEAAPPPPAPVAVQKPAAQVAAPEPAVQVAAQEPLRHEPSPLPPPVAAAPSAITAPPPPVAASPVTAPPPPVVEAAPDTPVPAVAAAKTSIHPPPPGEVDVEVEEGVAEVDIDALEEEEAEAAEAALLSDSVADLDVVSSTDVEDVPASSRRPIQLQTPADEPVSEPPRAPTPHPVPPESGRQVAVPVLDFDGDLSGVRSVPAVASPAPAELKADVTHPAMAAESPAVFRGEVPTFQPKTFGELLDATLGL